MEFHHLSILGLTITERRYDVAEKRERLIICCLENLQKEKIEGKTNQRFCRHIKFS